MSSSFKDRPLALPATPQWLSIISKELSLVVHEITALGEQLSAAVNLDPGLGEVPALQAFDVLAQKASALAALLAGLERRGPASLDELIAQIPFYDIRERLLRLAGRQSHQEAGPAGQSDEDMEWF